MLKFSVRKYLIILNLLFIYVFFNMNTSVARDMYPGQVVYGQIGKFGLDTTIKLPEGEWLVAGTASKNGTIRPEEIFFIKSFLLGYFSILYLCQSLFFQLTFADMVELVDTQV